MKKYAVRHGDGFLTIVPAMNIQQAIEVAIQKGVAIDSIKLVELIGNW